MEDPVEEKTIKPDVVVLLLFQQFNPSTERETQQQEKAEHRTNKYNIGSYSSQHTGQK